MSAIPCCQTILLPRSKSMLARKLCMRFIAGGDIQVMDDCDDIYYLSAALAQMRVKKNCLLDAGESATALRFLTAIASARADVFTVIRGEKQLLRRPVAPLVDALRALGAHIEYMGKEGYAPLRIMGRQLAGGTVDFTGAGSSQYASACLLISSMTTNGIEVIKHDTASLPYVEMTRQMLANPRLSIEPDWSAASYFYEWTALSGQPILLPHLLPLGRSCQGDAQAMRLFGDLCNVTTTRTAGGLMIECVEGGKALGGDTRIDMSGCPDLVPAVAITLAMKGIRATLTGLQALRIKETDRLESIKATVTTLGGQVAVTQQGTDYQMSITGEPMQLPLDETIMVNSYNDHRIAMCALAALSAPHLCKAHFNVGPIECINKSFPAFLQRIGQLKPHLYSL